MHPAGKLVEVSAAPPQERYDLFQFRQVQLYHIAVQGHFPQIGFPVGCPELGHLLLDQFQFLRGYPEIQLEIPFALGAAHRSGSRFFGAAGLWAGGSCLSFSRTEVRGCCVFSTWPRLRCSSRTRSMKPSSTAGWLFTA